MAQQKLQAIKKDRLQKLESLKKMGLNPYPSKIDLEGKVLKILEVRDSMDKIVLCAGRIWSIREHGAVIFMDLKDDTSTVQVLFQKKVLGEDFKTINLFDTGDFLAVTGTVVKTQAGEITVDATKFQLLTKSIRPLPSVWYGLKDEEERYRQRYVDLLLNDNLRDLFRKKALFWQSMREFLVDNSFLEVETPVLENTA